MRSNFRTNELDRLGHGFLTRRPLDVFLETGVEGRPAVTHHHEEVLDFRTVIIVTVTPRPARGQITRSAVDERTDIEVRSERIRIGDPDVDVDLRLVTPVNRLVDAERSEECLDFRQTLIEIFDPPVGGHAAHLLEEVDHHRRIDIRLGHHHTLDATIRPFGELDTVRTQTLPPRRLIRHQETIHPIVLPDVLRPTAVQRQTNSLTQTFLHRTGKIAGPAVIRTSAVLGRTEARV